MKSFFCRQVSDACPEERTRGGNSKLWDTRKDTGAVGLGMRKLREQKEDMRALLNYIQCCEKEEGGNLETLLAPGDKPETNGRKSGEVIFSS